MAVALDEAIRSLNPTSDGADYRLLRLPPNGITLAAGVVAEARQPFCALVVDRHEVSLLLTDAAVQEFSRRLRDAQVSEIKYRLITLDVVLDPQLVGFMARISRALAQAGISVLPFAAFSRDHIAVAVHDFDKALAILKATQAAE